MKVLSGGRKKAGRIVTRVALSGREGRGTKEPSEGEKGLSGTGDRQLWSGTARAREFGSH